MKILGIETSCDECSAAIVEDGKKILSNVIATQDEFHKPFYGVVPEIASRKHVEWISLVVQEALEQAGVELRDVDAIAATSRPGLIGSLLVGLSFAKGLALARELPFVAIDHIQAHIYAAQLEQDIPYPFLGLLISGGHSILTVVESYDQIRVLGTTIDDAIGEAFDKVAKFYDLGFPGGVAIDKLAQTGEAAAFRFPKPSLHKGDHKYDVSYSGLKTAVINQLDLFWNKNYPKTPENIAAAFQKAAVDMIVDKALQACEDLGLRTLVAGGGVSANSYIRARLQQQTVVRPILPSLKLCTDNGAMVAGLAYCFIKDGKVSGLDVSAEARVVAFRHVYP
jgi:N6-L-threonylcarbamoyladenine synthase